MVICAASYRKLFSRICVGSIGKNGRNSDAPAMLNMFPKFELVPISRYFITFAEARRPSMIPFVQYVQPRLQQNDVGRVARHVHRRGYRNSHVCGVQRRRVVDSVSHISHHVPAQLSARG